ncbi:MAG: 6-carboxytetrahydropterin synthase [Bacteroidota bacterium]
MERQLRAGKRFRWEAAHRLPHHSSDCRSLHGHSYRMTVEVEGTVGADGMVLDFQAIKKMVAPLVQAWDHATLVAAHDEELLQIVKQVGWKHFVFPADTTSEHLAQYVAGYLCTEYRERLNKAGVQRVRVRLAETKTCYAEAERLLEAPVAVGDRTTGEATL